MIVKSKGMSTDTKESRLQTLGLALPGWKLSEEVRIHSSDPDKLIVNPLRLYYSGDNNQPNDREHEDGKSKQTPNTGIV